MRVLTVVGCRPQFIKAAPVSRAFEAAGVEEILVHTGQHYDDRLSGNLLSELGLKLSLANPGALDLDSMTLWVRQVVDVVKPDWILVYGDTRSTLAGALGAGPVPVAHVEAGMRSGDWSMPEEHIRVVVDRLSVLHLCSDRQAQRELVMEGKPSSRAVIVGDVMADAVRLYGPQGDVGMRFNDEIFMTIHREANIPRLREIVERVAECKLPPFGTCAVWFHAHPRARAALAGVTLPKQVTLLEPTPYRQTLMHVKKSACVVTDSGGLQKEAYWLGTPCVTVRPNTEWTETVEAGANVLVEPKGIPAAVAAARFPKDAPQLYGDGHAAERIVEALLA